MPEKINQLPDEEKQQPVEEAHEEVLLDKEFREKKEAMVEIINQHDLSTTEGRIALGKELGKWGRSSKIDQSSEFGLTLDYYRELGEKLENISNYEALDYSQGIASEEHFKCLYELLSNTYGHCNADTYNKLIPVLYPERYAGFYWKLKHTGDVPKDQGRNQVCLSYLHYSISKFSNTMASEINNKVITKIIIYDGEYGYGYQFVEGKKDVPELPVMLKLINNWNETRKVWADLAYKLLGDWTDDKLPQFDFDESQEAIVKQLCDDLNELDKKIKEDLEELPNTRQAIKIFEENKNLFKKHSDIYRQILAFYNNTINDMSGKSSRKNKN